MTQSCRMIHILRQRPISMWESLGTTLKQHLTTDVVSSNYTKFTLQTSHSHLQCYSISDFVRRYLWTDCGYHACWLMTKAERCSDSKITISAFAVVVEVWTTNSGTVDLDLHFCSLWWCYWSCFLASLLVYDTGTVCISEILRWWRIALWFNNKDMTPVVVLHILFLCSMVLNFSCCVACPSLVSPYVQHLQR